MNSLMRSDNVCNLCSLWWKGHFIIQIYEVLILQHIFWNSRNSRKKWCTNNTVFFWRMFCVYNPLALYVCREILDSGPALGNAKMSQTSDGNLQISDVSEDDSNMYTCSVRHSNRSISAELQVLSKWFQKELYFLLSFTSTRSHSLLVNVCQVN